MHYSGGAELLSLPSCSGRNGTLSTCLARGISLLCLYGCSTLKFITTGEPEWEGQHTELQRNLFGGDQIPESHTSGLMCLFFLRHTFSR